MISKHWSWVSWLFIFIWSSFSIAADDNAQPKPGAITQTSTFDTEEEVWGMSTENRRLMRYPNEFGTVGTFRVRSAESLPTGGVTFGIGGEFYTTTQAPNIGYGSTNANTIAESIFLGFSPFENATFAVARRNSSTTFGIPRKLISSLGDFTFSGQYSFPVSDTLLLALNGDVTISSQFNELNPDGTTISGGAGALLSLSLFKLLGSPLFLHFNFLYHSPEMRNTIPGGLRPELFYAFSRFHHTSTLLGVEWMLGDFIPFLELGHTTYYSSGLSYTDSPSRLTLGTRITPISNKSLALLVGTDIGLGQGIVPGVPFNPPWQAVAQLSYTFALFSTERKHYYTTPDVGIVDRKFVISKNVNFKIGKAELEVGSALLLDQIAKVIIDNKIRRLLIVGHTDSSHNEDYNLKLSIDRAKTVKQYLVSKGIADEALIAQGYGKRKPKTSNATEEGRAINRRVEFIIID